MKRPNIKDYKEDLETYCDELERQYRLIVKSYLKRVTESKKYQRALDNACQMLSYLQEINDGCKLDCSTHTCWHDACGRRSVEEWKEWALEDEG